MKPVKIVTKEPVDPMKDPLVKSILAIKLPEKQVMVEGRYFKDSCFPEDTLKALLRHPSVGVFEVEHAIVTTE